jgi:pilus assembly protein Flp/PilA
MNVKRFLLDETGATAIEYGLITALISVMLISVVGSVGGRIQETFERIAEALANTQP